MSASAYGLTAVQIRRAYATDDSRGDDDEGRLDRIRGVAWALGVSPYTLLRAEFVLGLSLPEKAV